MKNIIKTTLAMSSILAMIVFPTAYANTVSEEHEYKQCVMSGSWIPKASTITKTSETTLRVWDQGWSTIGPQPKFELSYDFPKHIKQSFGVACL